MRAKKRGLSGLQLQLIRQIIAKIKDEELPPGHHFTEPGLAGEFNVSRSPVRAALQYLADQGVLEMRPNHGFFVAKSSERLDRDLQLPAHGDELLYMRIAEDRRRGLLDDHFTVSSLIRRYKCKRHGVVRVLKKLSADGLIRRSDGNGWDFNTLTGGEQGNEMASYRFRMAIEPAAILDPDFKIDQKKLKREKERHLDTIRRWKTKLSRAKSSNSRESHAAATEMFDMNADFHNMLASFSGNQFFIEAIRQQNNLRRLIEYSYMRDVDRVVSSCEQHLAIIEALEQGDRQWAADLMRQHLRLASE